LRGGRRAGTVGAVRSLAFACVLSLLGPAARPARADSFCPISPAVGTGPAEIPGEVRLAWIDARLARAAHHASLWTWGWGIGIGAAAVANLAALPFVARQDRIDWYTGAATTVIGIVPLVIAPLAVIGDSRALHASITNTPSTDNGAAPVPRGHVCVLVADAESRLVRDAQNQADGQRWWLHVGNVVLNFGVGLFLGIGYHHWGAGAFNALLGTAIGEALILTQPTASIGDLRRYRAGLLDDDHSGGAARAPTGAPGSGWGVAYDLRF
jgi:hypothetical protein